jgi:hypothetical protein
MKAMFTRAFAALAAVGFTALTLALSTPFHAAIL